jgi:hypothetical protein
MSRRRNDPIRQAALEAAGRRIPRGLLAVIEELGRRDGVRAAPQFTLGLPQSRVANKNMRHFKSLDNSDMKLVLFFLHERLD